MAEDRISSLPDPILISIVSLLPFKEVVRSCVLSHRWVHLWKSTGRFHFDLKPFPLDPQLSYSERTQLSAERGQRFSDWVYRVLNSSPRSFTLDELRVRIGVGSLIRINCCDVEEWIHLALRKQVKKLELDLCHWHFYLPSEDGEEKYLSPSLALRNANCKSLVVLRTLFLDVTDEDIQHIAYNCPFLEELTVAFSRSLVNLDIHTRMSRLKHFDLRQCGNLLSVQVYAPNLLSFRYHGQIIRAMSLKKDDLHLDKLTIGFCYNFFFLFQSSQWQSYGIKRLELDMSTYTPHIRGHSFNDHPVVKHGNIRELYVTLQEYGHRDLLWLISFIKASPLLHSLRLDMEPYNYERKDEEKDGLQDLIEFNSNLIVDGPHNLRTVLLPRCRAARPLVGLIMYLVKNATCLEKMTISLIDSVNSTCSKEELVDWIVEMKSRSSPGTELVVQNEIINF